MDDDFDVVETRVRGAITDHFNRVLNRPELLNRIGDNIVVFDFIRPSRPTRRSSTCSSDNIADRIEDQHDVTLEITPAATRPAAGGGALRTWRKGGRGIGSRLETWLVNPLARAMFDNGVVTAVEPITIRALDETASIPTLVLG